jgi:hypothetical protein
MAVEQETIEDLWASLGSERNPRVSQQHYRPVPGFRDVTIKTVEPPVIRGADFASAPQQPGLSLSVSDIPLVMEWLEDPTLPNAKRLQKEQMIRNENPGVQAGARRGTLNHVLYCALRAKAWNGDRGMSAQELIPEVFPTLKPQEKTMYGQILGSTPEINVDVPFSRVAVTVRDAYAAWLDDQANAEKVNEAIRSQGWQQRSFLDVSPQIDQPWQRMRDEFASSDYQASIKSLMTACEELAAKQTLQETGRIPIGLMMEATMLDNQAKAKEAQANVGSLQMKSRFDEVIILRDPKTEAISVALVDLKTGKKATATPAEDMQMIAMAHLVSRLADGLVVASQAKAGHRQWPPGFKREKTTFILTRAIADEDWMGHRVQRVTRRWLNHKDSQFEDYDVKLDRSTIGAFGELYGELIEHVGRQKKVLNVLLGRKSANK